MKKGRFTLRTALLLTGIVAAGAWCALAGAGPVRFAVISDPHLCNARLLTSGSALEAYLNQDPKLLKQSEAILESALASILEANVQFLIICGDLTKDGEVVDHVLMAQHLAKLEQRGVQVFVVPGNHDINNPDAVRYLGSSTRPVAHVSPNGFRALYQRFGYGQAIARDTTSLSYLAEPVPGLWLLAIDSCKYHDNFQLGTPVVSGRISAQTMSWILDRLQAAQAAGKQVIAFMHHGVNEHFVPEPILFPDYLVDDWPEVSAQLAAAGLKAIFTGHYHSQDAAYPLDANGNSLGSLCDVETGCLIQYPCPFGIVTIEGQTLVIHSERVTQIHADTEGLPFHQFAEQFLRAHMAGQVIQQLEVLFGLPESDAEQVAPLIIDALVANYAGDEAPSPETVATIAWLLTQPEPYQTLGVLLDWLWTDLPPGDNDLVLQPGIDNSVGRPGPIVPIGTGGPGGTGGGGGPLPPGDNDPSNPFASIDNSVGGSYRILPGPPHTRGGPLPPTPVGP
jgi:3',5'-cyclic AMP phosphodiesterase CpdA